MLDISKLDINELTSFFKSYDINYEYCEKYQDTIRFEIYGEPYTIRYTNNELEFYCIGYENIKSLIEAIKKKL